MDNPSLTSTSLATLAFVVALAHNGGCKRSTPGQDRIRIEDNIRQLVEFEKRQLATVDLERFVYVPPMPPGQPWEEPSPATTKSGINLTPARDGRFHEQYQVAIDPVGIKGRTLGTYKIGDGGILTAQGESSETIPGWCEIVVIAKLGAGSSVRRLKKRLEIVDRQLTEKQIVSEPAQ